MAARSMVLRAHIGELEELIDDLLPAARAGSARDRDRVVLLQKHVLAKR